MIWNILKVKAQFEFHSGFTCNISHFTCPSLVITVMIDSE